MGLSNELSRWDAQRSWVTMGPVFWSGYRKISPGNYLRKLPPECSQLEEAPTLAGEEPLQLRQNAKRALSSDQREPE